VRRTAIASLAHAAPANPEVVAALVRLARNEDESVASEAVEALGRFGIKAQAAGPALLEIIQKKPDLREKAIPAVLRLELPAETVIPVLVEVLNDNREGRRDEALDALGSYGPTAQSALRPVVALIHDESREVRCKAVATLSRIDPEGKACLPVLFVALEGGDEKGCKEAIEGLVRIGPPAVPALTRALGSTKWMVPQVAATALGGIGPPSREAVPALTAMLAERNTWYALAAVEALGRIGPAAKPAIPALRRELSKRRELEADSIIGREAQVRVAAAKALVQIDPANEARAAVASLVALGQHHNSFVRVCATQALGEVGPVDPAVVPALAAALQDRWFWEERAALEGLLQAGPKAVAALPTIIEKLDQWPWQGAEILAQIGPPARPAVPALQRLLERGGHTRLMAFAALRRIAPETPLPLTEFEAALHDQRDGGSRRLDAAKALVLSGADPKPAVPVLLDLLNHSNPTVRQEAAVLLKTIDPHAGGPRK
jgi:HEAT repeat protein